MEEEVSLGQGFREKKILGFVFQWCFPLIVGVFYAF